MENNTKNHKIGILCAIISAIIWGVLPIYWKALESVSPIAIMFYRLILAFVVVFIVCLIIYGPKEILKPLKQKKTVLTFFLAGFAISLNWWIYIWAVNSGNILQTSLGYYIDPLFVAVMGILIFREKLNKYLVISLLLALLGVCVMVVSYGQIPFMALGLGVSFATYTGIKKKLQAPSLLALLYETGLMLPIIVPLTVYLEVSGKGAFATADTKELIILSLAGILTAMPLLFFGFAANRISIISLGLIQYLGPSMALVIGIFMYNEPFDLYKLLGFVLIWIGLVFFTFSEIKGTSKKELPQNPNE